MPGAEDTEKVKAILDVKKNTTHEELCKDMPEEFKLMLDHMTKVEYTEDPGYDHLINLMEECAKNNGLGSRDNLRYEWQ